jgi:hypothetical protein
MDQCADTLPDALTEASALTGLVFTAALVLLLAPADEPEAFLDADTAVADVLPAADLAVVAVAWAALLEAVAVV